MRIAAALGPLVALGLVVLGPVPVQGARAQSAPARSTAPQSATLRGVESVPGVRLVTLRLQPEEPAFGEPFVLIVALRSREGLIAALSDSLFPTPTAQSAGPGEWTRTPAPGDSVDFAGAYPVIGFREGLIEYPWIGLDLGSETRYLRLGGIALTPFTPLDERGLGSAPRPPADVLGGRWSGWRVLGVTLLVLASLGTVVLVGNFARDRRRVWLASRLVRDPRTEALRELERILAIGWHRNGRVADFYAATGNALRRLAGDRDAALGTHLTSTELLARLGAEPTPGTEAMGTSLRVGERVKFGGFRPDPDTAERHWQAVRDWVREERQP